MTREEALNIFYGNIHKSEPIDIEAAQHVADGLMEILSRNHRKDLEVFGLEPFSQGKTLKDFMEKRPVGRPKIGIWGRTFNDCYVREEKYRPIFDKIESRYRARKNKRISLDRIIRGVANDLGFSYPYAKKAYYSVKSCYRK